MSLQQSTGGKTEGRGRKNKTKERGEVREKGREIGNRGNFALIFAVNVNRFLWSITDAGGNTEADNNRKLQETR